MEGDKVTSLYLEYDGDEFIIANLYKGQMSENLDLSFNLNEKISFKVSYWTKLMLFINFYMKINATIS